MINQFKKKQIGLWYYFKLSVVQFITQLLKKTIRSSFEWETSVRLKTYPNYPIYIRCGTSDYDCFHVIFIQNDYQEILHLVKEETLYMVDCGANVGYTALYFALHCPAIAIDCFEPDWSNYHQACKNLKSFSTIQIHQKAIWHQKAYVKVVSGDFGNGGKWALTVEECKPNEGVEALSLSEVLRTKQKTITFLKIDIEGAEKMLLNHPEGWIKQFNYLAIELHTPVIEQMYRDNVSKYQLQDLGVYGEMFVAKNI